MQENIPEAVASATFTMKSPNGFPLLFTVRSESEIELIERIIELDNRLISEWGFSPDGRYKSFNKEKGSVVGSSEKEFVPRGVCPKCGGRLVVVRTKTGKVLHRCEHGKYDYTTKTQTGCDYMQWQEDESIELDENVEPEEVEDLPSETAATPAQKAVLVDRGLWEPGMSKLKASKVIKEALGK